MAKEGSTVSGLMDSLATMTSLALQYGVPLRDLVNKFAHVRFEPSGFTGNAEVPIAEVDRGLRLPLARLALPAQGRPRRARHPYAGQWPSPLPSGATPFLSDAASTPTADSTCRSPPAPRPLLRRRGRGRPGAAGPCARPTRRPEPPSRS